MQKLIELEQVSKAYRLPKGKTLEVLKNITLTVYQGEVIGLLGINGAGKTTLSSILATLHPPTSGNVLYNGQSIYQNLLEFRKLIGFCPQKPNVSPYLTLRQSLEFAGEFYGLDATTIHSRVERLMNDFDLQKYAHNFIYTLSGGYKQRFMIARALMHNPKIVLLDEPTVALDAPVRRYLWEVIRELKKSGVTVILTTHYLEEAEALADRICLLHKGEIMLIDSPENLKTKFAAKNLESVFLTLLEEEANHD